MQLSLVISTFSKELKLLITAFLVVLSIGFYSGLFFVNTNAEMTVKGIQENYLGNEDNENATIMKFKKSEREMLTIVHSHILSMAMIFFFVGLLLLTTSLNSKIKLFLIIEPFISVILTFGGIYFLWKGVLFMKYIVIFSGMLMTLTYTVSVFVILRQLFSSKNIVSTN